MDPQNEPLRRFRPQAMFCALLFMACELIARPFTSMGLCDDWSYVRTAEVLARTGHIVYNGWATAMVGFQLYPAALLMKVFGESATVARATTIFVATLTVFIMQRLFVRCGLSERNATLATLAVALNPLYMELSASFMTDIPGLFAIVLCLYACVRALQAASTNATTGWIVFAVLSNAVLGSARQIAWLGLLMIVPCTLWLLRRNRQVLLTGVAMTALGAAFVFLGMHWFAHQPYSITEKIMPPIHGLHTVFYMGRQLFRGALEIFFLILAIVIAFLPQLRHRSKLFLGVVAVLVAGYFAANFMMMRHHSAGNLLEPLLGDWLGPQASYESMGLADDGPVVLGTGLRIVLTLLATLGTCGIVAFLLRLREAHATHPEPTSAGTATLSWYQLGVLLGPFTLCYYGLLIPRAATNLVDRYLIGLALVAALLLVRAYQQFIRNALPTATVVTLAATALFSIGSLHDMFALYRARVGIADEVQAAGIADNLLDGGFEHNSPVELERSAYINDKRLNPPGAFHPGDPYLGDESCDGKAVPHGEFPHFAPHLGIAFSPSACGGSAGMAPVSYFRWLGLHATSLYVVRYQPIVEAHGAAVEK